MNSELVENHLSFAPTTRVAVQVRNLSIIATKSNKTIVHDISMDLPSGSIMAIVGGSGSGKTTLLNVLASKIGRGLKMEGSYEFVADRDSRQQDITTAYLAQQDVSSPKLTVRETLSYAADLKLKAPKRERRRLVEELIAELGLKECSDTRVGDSEHRGLSGGEKRRLSIGVQMISNPSLLFLDEPTTGLDAYSAYLLVKTLRNLSQKGGRTFVMSIHQPRADILFLLDRICVLSKGFPVYCASVEQMVPYFHNLGFDVPKHVNPADYYIDLCSVDTRSAASMAVTEARLQKLVQHWKAHEKAMALQPLEPAAGSFSCSVSIRPRAPSVHMWRQVTVLAHRSIKLSFRDPVSLMGVFLEPVVIGVVTGWIFYRPDGTSPSGLRTTSSALYTAAALQGYLFLLFETYRLCEQDIKLYDRERAEGSVTPWAFVLSRRLANLVTEDIFVPLLFSVITYFMYGLQRDAAKFFIYFLVVLLIQQTSVSVALVSVAISRDFSQASLVGNLNYTLQSMACGYFVNAKKMPVYVRWTKYIAYLWYSFGALTSNQFTDSGCDAAGGECLGNALLDTLGYSRHWIAVPVVIILCWALGFYALALVFFYLKRVDISLAKEVKAKGGKGGKGGKDGDTAGGDLQADAPDAAPAATEVVPISIDLCELSMRVDCLKLFPVGEHRLCARQEKVILRSVNATFRPNMINAIMGPSGSGKSSLLNLISGRVKSNLLNSFQTTGHVLFNDMPVCNDMFKSVCCYVSQDDDHLLAKLTVRETLAYAAELRLQHMSKQGRREKVESLVAELGLKHCENTLVGNEFVKGISGGEKRRVSLGVQLLTDPPVLLLDEPTSGLDSFTSTMILEILNKLCSKAGKTVVLTIHQPRAELFQRFGNVLLLAKGGQAAFNGPPGAMAEYFSQQGYDCPPLTNVADFFLDLISVNTQNAENEAVSTERVTRLLQTWDERSAKTAASDSSEKTISNETFARIFSGCVRTRAGFAVAYRISVLRQLTTMRRNVDSMMARFVQMPGMGIILALFFAPIKHNYTSVSNRLGLVQQTTSLYFLGMLINLACYPSERDYFYKEFDDNVYGIAPFFLGYMTLEMPMELVASVVYSVFVVLICGLPRTAGNFFATVYCSFIIVGSGEALGIITNTLFERPGFVINVLSIVLSIGTAMSGLMSLQMSKVLRGFNYLSPLNYTVMTLINFAFPDDMRLTCGDGGANPDGSCIFSSGRDVIEIYGLRRNTQQYLGIAICVWLAYRAIAFAILKAKLEWFRR